MAGRLCTALRVFVRQPFTQTGGGAATTSQLAGAFDVLRTQHQRPYHMDLLTGWEALDETSFRKDFESKYAMAFTPANFRNVRLRLLERAHAMVCIHTSLSESMAFELAYNAYGPRHPVLFACSKGAELKTTLLRELDDTIDISYVTFDDPAELHGPVADFLRFVADKNNVRPFHEQDA